MGAFTEFVQLAAGATSAFGQIQQGRAASEAAESQAAAAQANALLAQQQAADVRARGVFARRRSQLDAAAALATGRVGFAAGNVALGAGGAPADFQNQIQRTAAEDDKTLSQNIASESNAFISKSNILLGQASGFERQAKSARNAGFLGAAGTLLETGSEVDFGNLFGKKPTAAKLLNRPGVPIPTRR